ncbi:signal peptide peptidase SppA [Fictibacillus aquaticus]|uniref:Signal peptide peptidase SppA n=1 Tax=Fictibacillus aquaticus TaxID=2021314 RepID=A0A235FB80_9BACL|nr:signal peptide peptidase SppA [Fictibacillus aquaticus]OYD58207.1 signal peptide peptidase SppA [Fictibacillus aquaticus]
MNKKRWIALAIAAVLFISSALFQFLGSLAAGKLFGGMEESWLSAGDEEFAETVIQEGDSDRKIVVLDVSGVIQDTGDAASFFESAGYNHRQFLKMLDQAGKDDSAAGIIIKVNSPGGGVVESAEIHKKIVETQQKHRKPVFISMGSMAASGGYYISAPADTIYANPATMTGSLGVIIQSMNYGELAEKLGVKWETIKSGPHKDILSPSRDMTKEEQNILQDMVDDSYDEFVSVISQGRKMNEDAVRKIADGRIYSGKQAKELGLVDNLGTFDDAAAGMKKKLGDSGLSLVQYELPVGFESLFQMSVQKIAGSGGDLLGIKQLMNEQQSPQLKYLYSE